MKTQYSQYLFVLLFTSLSTNVAYAGNFYSQLDSGSGKCKIASPELKALATCAGVNQKSQGKGDYRFLGGYTSDGVGGNYCLNAAIFPQNNGSSFQVLMEKDGKLVSYTYNNSRKSRQVVLKGLKGKCFLFKANASCSTGDTDGVGLNLADGKIETIEGLNPRDLEKFETLNPAVLTPSPSGGGEVKRDDLVKELRAQLRTGDNNSPVFASCQRAFNDVTGTSKSADASGSDSPAGAASSGR